MDGGRRLLRPLTEIVRALAPTAPFAASPDAIAFSLRSNAPYDGHASALVRTRRKSNTLIAHLERLAHNRLIGGSLVVALFSGVGAYAALRDGAYAAFVAANGTVYDQIAKASGFAIKAVTITGARELTENEILAIAGVSPRNSLVFLNAADIRANLKAVPLVKDVSVSKLFPNRLLIDLDERQPFALWQKDGSVSIVAKDGTIIDELHNARYESLPMVTGAGANEKLADYVALLEAAGDLRPRIRAGIYVAGRRWTLKTNSGVEIVLPERDPASALSRLALVEHDSHILEKDILSVDLRIPGRLVARLSVEAGSARQESLAKKIKGKGAQT